jgi:hexosaminidase
MKHTLIYFFMLSIILSACNQQQTNNQELANGFNIIPKPNAINLKPQFAKSNKTNFHFQREMRFATSFNSLAVLSEFIGPLLNVEIITDSTKQAQIILRREVLNMPNEGYRLRVYSDSIVISSETEVGIFYGLQTLAQMLPVDWQDEVQIPVCQIDDWPRFPYRGMHLDVCRHFYSVDFVKKYIDLMARYKLNTFHWHLTEDQGWRIEIKKYPKLTEIGAWRWEKDSTGTDSSRYGGFYTQEQIKDIVDYAAKRFITIIPEIEMPGHSRAALAAYPQFSCSGKQLPVANRWGVFEHVYCAGNDSTFFFLQDILDEVIALFPSTYVHIGGDECPKEAWEKCPKCQARIETEGLKNEHELQSYFIRRIEKYLISKNRKLIGWDEILEGGLAPEATVMSWRGISGGIAAAKEQHEVIMTPGAYCYFDHYQANPKYEPKAIGGYTTLKKVYSYEPIPDSLTKEEAKYILGAQANMWTEYIATEHHLEYMLLPRMLALAEVDWTNPKNKSWEDFNQRLQSQFQRFDREGTNYCPGDYSIQFSMIPNPNGGDSLLKMESEIYQAEIHYSYDNRTEPRDLSPEYTVPIEIAQGDSVKASVFENGKAVHGFSIFVR